MKNKILLAVLLIFFLLFAILLIYINNVFLPVKVKTMLTQRLSDYLGKDVQIEKIRYNLFKGLIINNFVIFDKTKDKENLYLQVKEISFNFLILPIFKEKKIIIPVLHIDSPQLNLILRKDRTLNIQDLFKKKKPAIKEKPRFALLIYKIGVTDGKLSFKDKNFPTPFIKEIIDLKIGARLDLLAKVNFLIEGKIPNATSDIPTNLNLTGTYNLSANQIESNLKLEKAPINEYLLYLSGLPVALSNGVVDTLDLKINFLPDKEINLKGKVATQKLEIRKEKLYLAGNIDIEPDLKYDLGKNKLSDYKVNFKLSDVSFAGIDYLKELTDIKGDINLKDNKILTDNLKVTLYDSPLDIKASLENFLNPYLKLTLSSEKLDLEKLKSVLPALPKDLILSGNSTLNMSVEGLLKKLPLEVKGSSEVLSASLQLPQIKEPLNEIKGKIEFSLNSLNWQDFSFLYKEKPFQTSGKLTNFKQPQIDFNLVSKELDLKTSLNIRNKIITVKNCAGKYLNSDFNLKGDIDIRSAQNPLLDIAAQLNFTVKDLNGFLPAKINETLKKIKFEGLFNLSGYLKGGIKDSKDWALSLNMTADSFSISDLKLENLNLKLNQKNRYLSMQPFTADTYGGKVEITLTSNLDVADPLYNAKVTFSNIDLKKLKMDTKLKEKDISGQLNLEADLQTTARVLDDLRGMGYFSMKDGNLWQLNIFKGLGEFLFLPLYQNIVFKKAQSNFVVENKAIHTSDAYLESDKLDLNGEGKIGFEGNLDFNLSAELNAELIKDSPDLRKFTSAIMGNLLAIKVTGTLQKPEFKTVIPVKALFRGIKRFFLDRQGE